MRDYFTEGISKGVSAARVEEFKRQASEPEKRVFFHNVISKVVYIGGIACVVIICLLNIFSRF